MMIFVAAASFFALFVLQTSVFGMFGGRGPDAALLAAIFFGLRFSKYPGLQAGIVAGLIQDASSHGLMGINLLSKGLLGMGAGWLTEKHLVESKDSGMWAVMIFLGTIINQFVLGEFFSGFFDLQVPFWSSLWNCLVQSALNITAGMLVYSALWAFEARLERKAGLHRIS